MTVSLLCNLQLYTDNFYSSPALFLALLDVEIRATGMLQINRTGVPSSVEIVNRVLQKKTIQRETGYYIHNSSTNIVFVCWKDVLHISATVRQQ